MSKSNFDWTDAKEKYLKDNWSVETTHSLKLKLECTWYAVTKKAEELGLPPHPSNRWTTKEKQTLRELSEIYHYKTIARMMNKTEDAIYLKARRLGITLLQDRRKWPDEEETFFKESWGSMPIENLAKKMKRTVFSFKVKATRMKLGSMLLNNSDKLFISDIVDLLNVSHDRIYSTWKKLGLNVKLLKLTKKASYMYVTLEDLIDFLEKNQSEWDSRHLEVHILGLEPEWLKEKRKLDFLMPIKEYSEYGDDEIAKAKDLLHIGKDYVYIGAVLNRTPKAVAAKLRELVGGYRLSRFWKGWELKFLKDNYKSMTYKQIGAYIGRTGGAVSAKALEMEYKKKVGKEKMNSNDIYNKVNAQVREKDFHQLDIEGKKELINTELVNYTLEKIKHFKISQPPLDLAEVLKLIDETLETSEEKNEFFRHYTHYILKVASGLQGWEIIWWEEDALSLQDKPLITFNDDNKWDTLTTHRETPPINITLFVLDIFDNQFAKNEAIKLQKTISPKTKQ